MTELPDKDKFNIDKARKIKVNKKGLLMIPLISKLGERIYITLDKKEAALMFNEITPFNDFFKLKEGKGH